VTTVQPTRRSGDALPPTLVAPTGFVSRPLDLRVRIWLKLAQWLQAAGVYPTMEGMGAVPTAKRAASKPPRWLTRPLPADVAIEDLRADASGPPAKLRIYRSANGAERSPLVLFIHGGGFVTGGLDAMQFLCAQLASAAHAVVVSVEYPLAPEHPYPAALNTNYAALRWVAEHAEKLRGDPNRLIVMGDSAGGNLAAALCLLARRKGGPSLERQVLIYPALDATLSTAAMRSATVKRRAECETFYGYYAGDASPADELISPLLADDLSELPPATIITAEHDSLREDGLLYATRLGRAGVRVRYTNYLGMPHGFLSMPRICSAAPQAIAEIVQAISSNV
jgi:acetyl esterase/lipase